MNGVTVFLAAVLGGVLGYLAGANVAYHDAYDDVKTLLMLVMQDEEDEEVEE